MKCSLLTLSCYVDSELDAVRAGEVEAHVVGCQRCRRGLENLREEMARVGDLSRIHLPDASLADLMFGVNLIHNDEELPERTITENVGVVDRSRPWLGDEVGRALPWRSQRPQTPSVADAQASLGGVAWAPQPPLAAVHSGTGRAEGGTPAAPASTTQSSDSADDSSLPNSDESLNHAQIQTDEAVAAAADGSAVIEVPDVTPTSQQTDVETVDSLDDIDIAPVSLPARPLRRARAPRSRIPFFDMLREKMALARALRSHGEEFDDSIEIVSGSGAPPFSRVSAVRAPVAATASSHVDVVGSAQTSQPDEPAQPPVPPRSIEPQHHETTATDPFTTQEPVSFDSAYEAFAPESGSSTTYDSFASDDVAAPVARFPHDAVARRSDGIDIPRRQQLLRPHVRRSNPLERVRETAAALWSSGATAATSWLASIRARGESPKKLGRHRAAVAQSRRQRIDRRGVVVIVAVVAVLGFGWAIAGHRSPISATSSSTQSSAPAQPAHSSNSVAATQSSAAAQSSASAMTIANPITLGSGATGIQLSGIRYGNHPGDFRIVMDLTGWGTPATVVGFTDPQTLVIVLNGTASAGNLGSLPANSVVTGVTQLTAATPGQLVIQFKLAHSVTTTQGFLSSPLRLVIDLS